MGNYANGWRLLQNKGVGISGYLPGIKNGNTAR